MLVAPLVPGRRFELDLGWDELQIRRKYQNLPTWVGSC